MINTLSSCPRKRESSHQMDSRRESCEGFVSLREHRSICWIPAGAGMTARGQQQGFSLVSAIFLLVVIAALGTFAVTLSTTQQMGEAVDVIGARGYQAARAGIEWGAFEIVQSGVAGTAFASACQPGPTSASFVPTATTLNNFNVTVTCIAQSFVEPVSSVTASGVVTTIHTASSPLWVYQLSSSAVTSTATAGSPGYVERGISVLIAQ